MTHQDYLAEQAFEIERLVTVLRAGKNAEFIREISRMSALKAIIVTRAAILSIPASAQFILNKMLTAKAYELSLTDKEEPSGIRSTS